MGGASGAVGISVWGEAGNDGSKIWCGADQHRVWALHEGLWIAGEGQSIKSAGWNSRGRP